MAKSLRILVGVIGAPHGVRGECRLKSFMQDPAAIGQYQPLTDEHGRTSFTILAARPIKDDMLVARFAGVSTREAAAALTNTRLFVERSLLPSAEEDEFYHADLIGLAAEMADGRPLGRVAAIPNFGAGDLLEVQPEVGDTVLIPFTKAFVPIVDLAAGRLVVSPEALGDDQDVEPGEAEARPDAADDPSR